MKTTNKHVLKATLALIIGASPLLGDAALEDANRKRREDNQFNQEIQQQKQRNQSTSNQNLENELFDSHIDENQSLTIPPPQPLWNNGSGD